jgi:hypothetical protein
MPDSATPPTPEPNDAKPTAGETPADFEAWLTTQPESVQKLYESHTSGLRSALQKTRQEKADEVTRLRDAADKATGELKSELQKLADGKETEARRADFYEAASGAGCSDLKLAFLAAKEMDAFKRDGSPDMDAVKAAHPSLFAQAARPDARPGVGSRGGNGKVSPSAAINDHIRRAAGKSI